MNCLRLRSRVLAAAMGSAILACGTFASVPGAGASTRGGAVASAARASTQEPSARFVVRNHSSHMMRLLHAYGSLISAPTTGATIPPGASAEFEVPALPPLPPSNGGYTPTESYGFATYEILDGPDRSIPGVLGLSMAAGGVFRPQISCVSGGFGVCSPSEGLSALSSTRTVATFVDNPGTEVTIGPDRAADQDSLLGLCGDADATCAFKPTKEESILTDFRIAGDKVGNDTDRDLQTTYSARDTVTVTTGAGSAVAPNIEKLVESAVTDKYDRKWTSRKEFSKEFTITVPPHTTVWALHRAPIIRDTGEFTIALGNTTWHLDGISFDTPDGQTGSDGEFRLRQETTVPPSGFSQHVTPIGVEGAQVSFTPAAPTELVDLHYRVNNGQQQDFRMSDDQGIWRHTITGLSANDAVTYWFSYESDGKVIDSTRFTHTQRVVFVN